MKSLNVAVVGGGPAGLLLARMLRLRDPSGAVTVYERNPPDAAFGFGVVLSDRTMGRLRAADPATSQLLAEASVGWTGMRLTRRGEVVQYNGHPLSAISRKTLLRILQDQAAAAGATLRFGVDIRGDAELSGLADGHDLVALASGANCVLRGLHQPRFGTTAAEGGGRYIWFGTTTPFRQVSFAFEATGGSVFAAHAYPYETGLATYIVTTDDDSWRAARMDDSTESCQRPGDSDHYSRQVLERVFHDHLKGGELLANNTKWTSFRVVRNRRLSAGSMVLLGDAAHTAHPSVGSGTKLAIEDAIVLAGELCSRPTVTEALTAYEHDRRPAIERTQQLAEPSMRWWESYPARMSLDLRQLGFHYLTRTTALGYAGLARRDPKAVSEVERWFEACHGSVTSPAPHAAAVRFGLGGAMLRNRIVTVIGADVTPSHLAGLCRDSGLVVLDPVGDSESWRPAAAKAKDLGTATALAVRLDDRAVAARAAAGGIGFLYAPLDPSGQDPAAGLPRLRAEADAAGLAGLAAGLRVPRAAPWTTDGQRFLAWCDRLSADVVAFVVTCDDLTEQWERLLAYADLMRARTGVATCVPAPQAWTVPADGITDGDMWAARLQVALLSGRADLICLDLRAKRRPSAS
jgi:salicyloyl-CoA 5-hydroxylase